MESNESNSKTVIFDVVRVAADHKPRHTDAHRKSRRAGGVGILGVMTELAWGNYQQVFQNKYATPIAIPHHTEELLSYAAASHDPAERSCIKQLLLKDAQALQRNGFGYLTTAILDYEPIVEEIAKELDMEVISLSQTLVKNCGTLSNTKQVGMVGLTNDCGRESVLATALSKYQIRSVALGREVAKCIGVVEEFTAAKQSALEREILDDLKMNQDISVIILIAPELYALAVQLKQKLKDANSPVIVWNTAYEQEFSLRFFNHQKQK